MNGATVRSSATMKHNVSSSKNLKGGNVLIIDKGEPRPFKRERFLRKVVDQIEVDRLSRHHHRRTKARQIRELCTSTERRTNFIGNNIENNAESYNSLGGNSLNNSRRASKLAPLTNPTELSASSKYNGENRDFIMSQKHRDTAYRKLPHIHIKSPSQDQLTSDSFDIRAVRSPLSPSFNHRDASFTSYGPFYGFRIRQDSPKSALFGQQTAPPAANFFSWKICTPTNWKRVKSYHEILLERKLLRRKGKQPSQSQFISVFSLKDARNLKAGDRIKKALRRAQFHGDDLKRLPLVRFRRAVRTLIAMLKTVKLSRDKGKGLEPSTWIEEDNIRTSRRAYDIFGVSFDAYSYRARKDIQISNETKAILSMAPGSRSEEQMHVALVSLSQAVPEFGEFPIAMQEALVRVGWYETFEARRIIIREGHMADNFYLILSGSAVVTIREQNAAGEYFGRTVAILQRGNSFGEMALIYGGKRSATVTCKDNVELLAVGRDDYIDIFMHKTKDGTEPEHIKFLKQIKVFFGWPIHTLPLDDPSIFLYTYVRRGMLLCRDSNESEWIYVIKSGSCRVLASLNAAKPSFQPGDRFEHVKDTASVSGSTTRAGDELRPSPIPPRRLSPLRSRESCPPGFSRAMRLPSIATRSESEVQEAAEKHRQELDEILKKRNTIPPSLVTEIAHNDRDSACDLLDSSRHRTKSKRIFVNLQTLQAKDVFGLESVVLSVFKEPTSTSLVSDGAECIMISKKFFQQKLTEDVAKKIRTEIRPLPSEEVLQEKLQTKTDWDNYRAVTVADFVDFRKHVHTLLDL